MGKRLSKRIKASDRHALSKRIKASDRHTRKHYTIYIHYGDDCFRKERFHSVENRSGYPCNKPSVGSGLWASPVNADFGWKDFCIREDFRIGSLDKSFKFRLAKNARIYHIYTTKDLFLLPEVDYGKYRETDFGYMSRYCIDYEKVSHMYDAIELHLFNSDGYRNDSLDFYLYGWDCDSIIIFNPDIIKEV